MAYNKKMYNFKKEEEPTQAPQTQSKVVEKAPVKAPSARIEDMTVNDGDWQIFLVRWGRKRVCASKICTPVKTRGNCLFCFSAFQKKLSRRNK